MSDESAPQTYSTADTGPLPNERAPLTPEEQFVIDEARALRDMAAAAGWFRRESAPPTWGIAARIEATQLDADVSARVIAPTPRKEGVTADVDREAYAERGRLAAARLREIEAREHEEHRARLARFDAEHVERIAAIAELERVRDEVRVRCVAEMRVADAAALRAKDALASEREALANATPRESVTLRIVSERFGSAVKRTAAEVVGEIATSEATRAKWRATDGRLNGSTYWSNCAKAGRPLWRAAVIAWAGRT